VIAKSPKTVFLFDVDNTLVDNDRIVEDLRNHLNREIGHGSADEYFEIFERLREEIGYSDYLGALQRYRDAHPREPQLIKFSMFLVNYHFANRLFPGSLDAVAHVARLGLPVVLSDGDVVFQPRKVERSGLYDTFGGRVLIYIHKEKELDDVELRYPADHYVLVDDKVRILSAVKDAWGARVTTVFPRQGHYAADETDVAKYPPADVTLARIGDLCDYDLPTLVDAAARTDSTRRS
jgi:FMN phosphatase YigB (HAD superfamily)